jgi:hypothetical protein
MQNEILASSCRVKKFDSMTAPRKRRERGGKEKMGGQQGVERVKGIEPSYEVG